MCCHIYLQASWFTSKDGTIDFESGYRACKTFPGAILDPYIDWKFLKNQE